VLELNIFSKKANRFCAALIFLFTLSQPALPEPAKTARKPSVTTTKTTASFPDNDPVLNEPIVKAVSRALPAVVNINTEKVIARTVTDPSDELFNQFFGSQIFNRRYAQAQTVRSLGTGFFVDPSGFILTNEHVVERAADLKIKITTLDGKTYNGIYVYGERDRDLALLKIEEQLQNNKGENESFPFIDTDNCSPNVVGQSVIALGNPIGYQSSVSSGILSGKDRTVGTVSGLLQTDAGINPGNSGGPLVDIMGRLVGVNSMKISFSQGVPTEKIAFAIPGDIAADWVKNAIAIAKGEKKPPEPVDTVSVLKERFGIVLQDLTPDLAQALGFRMISGVLISDTIPGSPAEKAGLKSGLVLRAVGRYVVSDINAIPKELGKIKPGNEVTLLLVRPQRKGNILFYENIQLRLIAK